MTANLREPGRGTPVASILLRAADLLHRHTATVASAAADIDRILAALPITLVPALDRAFRDAGLHHDLGLRFLDLRARDLDRIELCGGTSGALGVASLVRDGHAREAAVRRLAHRVDRLGTAFLINRLNDYVGPIADLAWAGLQPRLTARHAELVVRCLPLIVRMSDWVRAGVARRQALEQLVRSPAARPALWDSLRDRDLALVRAAAHVLVGLYRGQPEIRDVFTAALARRDPWLRIWAGHLAVEPAITPPSVLQELAPVLAADRNPAVRVVGVRGFAARGDREGLIRATFDPQGLVRHHARVLLAEQFGAIDYRGHGLATLADPASSRAALVGALAVLSDFGRRPDIPAVAAFVVDPRPSVAREARRTLELLERLP
ncbi:HEAT repeat domain-containing protein [Nannocystis punicea]|uniref:HEAT repeat-containing protein n=1 Tax=Nannocystis punicea TaxID=2995304 RepID=A0ABY7HHE3_9BACT|nr:hypothetical protein [Nannocystis poenicansa]WAS98729.1 hypothetical protein O0S08_21565 [Nannocystis poenicansa]